MEVVLLKGILAAVLSVPFIAVGARISPAGVQLDRRAGYVILTAAVVLFRLAPFAAYYLVLGREPTSDIPIFWEQARSAAEGKLVYRDFWSPYSPLFVYLLALGSLIWYGPLSVVMTMMLVEILSLVATAAFLRRTPLGASVGKATLLYLVSPAPLSLVVLGGQEDTWVWLAGLGVAWVVIGQLSLRAGLVAGCGFLATKALFGLPMAMILFMVRHPVRYALGCLAVLGPIHLALWLLAGSAMLESLLGQERLVVPPNLWVLLNIPLRGGLALGSSPVTRIGLATAAALGCWFAASLPAAVRRTHGGFIVSWIFLFNAFLLLSTNALGNYAAFYLLPLTFLIVALRDRLGLALLMVVNIVVTVQPSLWYRLGSPLYDDGSLPTSPLAWLELLLGVALIAAQLAIMWRCRLWAVLLPRLAARSASRHPA